MDSYRKHIPACILDFLHEHDGDNIRASLNVLPKEGKGNVFEYLLAELYRGNGWLVYRKGARGDAGADILLYHPKTPSKVAIIVQAKNHSMPLTFDQVRIELIKFEEQSAPLHKCQNFRLVAVNGFVRETEKLGNFNLLLDSWKHIEELVSNYDPESIAEPSIELFAHNRITYKQIYELWEDSRHVAVVQATGTGKSYLIAKVLADFHDKHKVVLAPSTYILEQQKSKMPWLSANIDYLTYAKLARMADADIIGLDSGLIVLDEFHRCGADVWGKGVQKLLDSHPKAKVLGTTATPIRYLDYSRDMAEELFDGIVAENLSLAEAIVRRILSPPTYISALYTLNEECASLVETVKASKRSDEEKIELKREIKSMRLDWEKTSGVPEILKKYLPININKLIVFCKNQQHLDEMEIEVQRWFQKAGTHRRRKVYRVLSAEPENDRYLDEFKKAKSKDTVHLLFAIDMLNEGLHIPEVGAVILLRPTESPIIFYQQIGRCIQVGKDHTPIIFDLVNNFQNIRANDFLADLEEFREIESRHRTELGLSANAPYIKVVDLAKQIEEIVKNFRERCVPWGIMFDELVKFKEKNGHCDVEHSYKGDFNLGSWVSEQRRQKVIGRLPSDRVSRLDGIGFGWNGFSSSWDRLFSALCHYKDINGHCNVPWRYDENPSLGSWVVTQRGVKRKGNMPIDRIQRLETIGFVWEPHSSHWEMHFKELLEYQKQHGHCIVPSEYGENKSLSSWVTTQRVQKKSGKLSADKVRRLEDIGFDWNGRRSLWEIKFEELQEYQKQHGHCNVPLKYKENPTLGKWITKLRIQKKNGKLSADKVRRLEDIGFDRIPLNLVWEAKFEELLEYQKQHGHCNVPRVYEENPSLGLWVTTQRGQKKNGKMSVDRVKRLEGIGFDWNQLDSVWEKRFEELLEYQKQHGHCNIPLKYKENPILGKWVRSQLIQKISNTLSTDRVKRLEGIGFDWNQLSLLWEMHFEELLEYQKQHGHCNVPQVYEENPSLGLWVTTQRGQKKNGKMSADKVGRLEGIGFDWNRLDSVWEKRFEELLEYQKQHGHCNVPQVYEENPSLGTWVAYQVRQKKNGKLPADKVRRLDGIGFERDRRKYSKKPIE